MTYIGVAKARILTKNDATRSLINSGRLNVTLASNVFIAEYTTTYPPEKPFYSQLMN